LVIFHLPSIPRSTDAVMSKRYASKCECTYMKDAAV
jgi:hypothetical protein